MTTREEALAFGLSYPDTCQDAPFHDPNWQLVRIKSSKKVFLWTYEKDGYINLNVKADPEWRDYWRSAFASVTAGYHLNKEHWSTIILDGTVPDDAIKNMIDESYRMVTDSPTKRIYEAVKKIPKGKVADIRTGCQNGRKSAYGKSRWKCTPQKSRSIYHTVSSCCQFKR